MALVRSASAIHTLYREDGARFDRILEPSDELSDLTLFMIEIKVPNWPRAVDWYTGVLGLTLVLRDDAHQFALLEAGAGRIALKAGGPSIGREAVRLIFQVDDVDAERERLIDLGVAVGDPIDHSDEGYREVRLGDPDGTPIRLFGFTR